jgi:Zn-dependent protease
MFSNFDPKRFIISLVVVVLSIALHEFGHAISADRLGDDTPRRQGRITLWPDKHFDAFGFILIVVTSLAGFGLGYGKPVMVNPRRLKHPNRDMMIIAAFGPLMNLLLAVVFGLILRVAIMTDHTAWMTDASTGGESILGMFASAFLFRNLGLMFFNLIPIYPLDGSKILFGLLPARQANAYDAFMSQYGYIILMTLVFMGTSLLSRVLSPAILTTAHLITGVGWE